MSDNDEEDKVQPIDKGGKAKDPKAKLREEFEKTWAPKLNDQLKKTVSAIRIANTEKKTLADLRDEYEGEKVDFNNALKDVG